MAEMGAIGRNAAVPIRACGSIERDSAVGYSFRADGVLSGNVKTAGTNEPLCHVFVLNRYSMRPIAHTWTDASGNWSISGLDPDALHGYVVVIQDPATGSLYNDGIFAQVTPVAP